MHPLSMTRTVKILKHLRRTVPKSVPRSSLHALEKLPAGELARLRTGSDWAKATDDVRLKSWLADTALPSIAPNVSGSLFNGTLVFAQVAFVQPGLSPSGVSAADTQTAIDYATLAAAPISLYASQYGPNTIRVWPVGIPFTANLQGSAFSEGDFEGWVDDVAQFMRSQQVPDPCIVILHNRSLLNSPTFTGNRNSFHNSTGAGTPYIYSLVFDEGLSVADNNHVFDGVPNEKVYAHILSHEFAEMVVDPKGDDSNPEVCDPCATNCNTFGLFELFDQYGGYIGGTQDTASASGFAFFISAIVRPGLAHDSNFCLTQGGDVMSACVYAPPVVSGQLLSYQDDGTPGNVSAPVVVGYGGWTPFKFLFAGADVSGQRRIYAVNAAGQLLSYGDDGLSGNVSDPVVVGLGGWSPFTFLFAGQNASGDNRIYAVNAAGQLLSYGDDGNPGNVSNPVIVGLGGWAHFKYLFAGKNASGDNRIYAVNAAGQLLSYGDNGSTGNVSAPVIVGLGGWSPFKFLFSGVNLSGQNRIYAVNAGGQLLSYGDNGAPGNVSAPIVVGFDDWLGFKFLFAGADQLGQNRIYAVVT